MNRQSLTRIARAYSLLELPAWGQLLNWAGAFDDELWRNAPRKRIRGKWHGYLMSLDLRNWSERQTYLLGRFYDLPTQLLIRHALKQGQHFADIGANIGMITLLAAKQVGATGCVEAFEPNPVAFGHLCDAVQANDLHGRVRLHSVALSEAPGRLILSVVTDHTGMGTLADIPEQQLAFISSRHEVEVITGDSLMLQRPRLDGVKVDVEGFECHVFAGLAETLRRDHPWIVAEVVPEHLERAGKSEQQLFSQMLALGYEAFALRTQRRWLTHRLRLVPVDPRSLKHGQDVLFMMPGDPTRKRLQEFIS